MLNNVHIFVAFIWRPVLKGLLFLCHLAFTWAVARGGGGGGEGDNARQILD